MDKELESLSNTLLEIYQKNLSFLKENNEELYKKVEALSDDLASGKVEEKYTLEYKNGYFDIFNTETKHFFYNRDSYQDADNRADHVNFTKDGSLDLLRSDPVSGQLTFSASYHDVMPIVHYMNQVIDYKNIEFQKIFKFVFIGTGLGFHLQEINKKLEPFITFVIEPELEIFRLSLFVTDYSVFDEGNRTIQFSVGQDKQERYVDLATFYKNHNFMNYSIKHYQLLENYQYIKDELVDFFASNSATNFPYKLVLQNLERLTGFIDKKHDFIDVKKLEKNRILADKPVLLVSAGPSVDNYIEWIKENQDKFIIVCVDVITRKLEKHSIVPDIVVSIDPLPICADFMTTDDPDYLKNSAFVFLSQQAPKVLELVKDKKFYFSQVINLLPELGYLGTVPNVGTFAFNMTIHLGATEVYLVGNDAAFNQETGDRYSKDSSFELNDSVHEHMHMDDNTISNYDILEVEGNLREKVQTNRELLTFKDTYEQSIQSFKNVYKYKAYNLSDGVLIDGLEPLSREGMDKKLASFKEKTIDIHELMDSISTVPERLHIEDDIKILNGVITRVKKYQKQKVSSKDDFLAKKLDLMIWILEQCKKTDVTVVGDMFLLYTELVDIYVNFTLNLRQKDLHTNEVLNKISRMWSDGVISVFKDIKKSLKK